jgi:hypothetical protein
VLAALALVLYILFHPGVRGARGEAVRSRHPAASLNRASQPDQPDVADQSDFEAVVDLAHHRRKRA